MSEAKPQTQITPELVKEECKDVWVPTWGTVRICSWHQYVVIIHRNGWVTIYDIKDGEPELKAYVKTTHVEFDHENSTVTITTKEIEAYNWVLSNPLVIMEGRTSWVVVMA